MDDLSTLEWTAESLTQYLHAKFDPDNTISNAEKDRGKGHEERAKQLTKVIHVALPFWRDYRRLVQQLFTLSKEGAFDRVRAAKNEHGRKETKYVSELGYDLIGVFKILGRFEAGIVLRVRGTMKSLEESIDELSKINRGIPVESLKVKIPTMTRSGGFLHIDESTRLKLAEDIRGDVFQDAQIRKIIKHIVLCQDRLSLEATIYNVLEQSLGNIAKANGSVGSEIEDWIGSNPISELFKDIRPNAVKATNEAVTFMVGMLLGEVTAEAYKAELKNLVNGVVTRRGYHYHGSNGYADKSVEILKSTSWR